MSADTKPTAPSREALLAVHNFPCEFVIKAFGTDSAFESAAIAAATSLLGQDRVQAQTRTTTSGTRRCVTLTLKAETVEDVEAVYDRLYHLPDLMLLL